MTYINRTAIVVQPREGFWNWACSLEDDPPIDLLTRDDHTSVYLVEAPENAEPEQLLRKHFAAIFEDQLNGWSRDAAKWPKRRTFEMFQDWFEGRVVDLVVDLGSKPIDGND